MSEKVIGSVYVGKSDKFQTGMSVDREVSKTLMTGGECAIVLQCDKEQPIRLGNVYDDKFGSSFGGCIWDTDGIAPTLKTTAAASQQFVVQKVGNNGTD